MTGDMVGVIELIFVFGVVLSFGIWQLMSVARSQHADRERAAKSDAVPDDAGHSPR